MKLNHKLLRVMLVAAMALGLCGLTFGAPSADELKKIEAAAPAKPTKKPLKARKLLVIDLCKGFAHSSIPYCDAAIKIMGEKTGAYTATISNDLNTLLPDSLNQYDAVLFNNTTHLKIDDPVMRKSIMDFIKGGKGIAGIHAATDNFYTWPEMQEIMGGKFIAHPWGGGGTWAVKIDEPSHPLTAAFKGKGFKVNDEIYTTQAPLYSREKQRVVMSLDFSDPVTRDVNGRTEKDSDVGLAWIKEVGKGRLFYCSMGHNHHLYWTPAILQHYLDGIQYALGDYPMDATPKAPIDGILQEIAGYNFGDSRDALNRFSALVRGGYGNAEKLAAIETKCAEFLAGDGTLAGKDFVCRQLSLIGTDISVPVLGKMLVEEKTSDMARYAIERIQTDAADKVLLGALKTTSGKEKIGIISTLGQRQREVAVDALAGLVQSNDEAISVSAINALGQIGNEKAIGALLKAKNGASDDLRMTIMDAFLRCADTLADDGEDAKALDMYKEAYKPGEDTMIRVAALRGMVFVAGDEIGDILIGILKGNDTEMQTVAIGLVSDVPGEEITKKLVEQLPSLSDLGQVQLVSALGNRGDKAAVPAIVKLIASKNSDVRIAALNALGLLGDDSTVMVLANAASTLKGAEGDAAKNSLYRLRGAGIDSAIINNIKSADSAVKVELITAVGKRSIYEAVDALIAAAGDSDRRVRRMALRVMGDVASGDDVAAIVDVLVNLSSSADQREASRSLASILRRSENKGLDAVLAAYAKESNAKTKGTLLELMGKTGDAKALAVILSAAKDSSNDVVTAAIRAMSEWPDDAPADVLLGLAKSGKTAAIKILSLRGYINVLTVKANVSAVKTAEKLAVAMDIASRVDEKRQILSALPKFVCKESLALAEKCTKDADLASEAKLAVDKLKEAMANLKLSVTAGKNAGEAGRAIDDDKGRRWSTNAVMAPGDWFMIDMGREAEVSKLVIDTTGSNNDYPRGYEIYVSFNGDAWDGPVLKSDEGKTVLELEFPKPTACRYIKIVQMGKADGLYWSIHDLKVIAK